MEPIAILIAASGAVAAVADPWRKIRALSFPTGETNPSTTPNNVGPR
jgi:hypothetical protein